VASAELRFDALYRTHADAIRGYCLRRLEAQDAFDAAADVFVVVWQRLEKCPAGDEAKLWIYGIARNIVANRRRKSARSHILIERAALNTPGFDPGPEPVVVRHSEYEELDAALIKLPDKYREVLILAEWDGLDRESIAALEGVTRNAIDKRISRAYEKLAHQMNRRTARETVFTVPQAVEEGGEA